MKVLIAPDSFKGSLPAPEAAAAIAHGWRRVFPDADLQALPIADGGEGTMEALVAATGGEVVRVKVNGPLCNKITARYGVLGPSAGGHSGEATAVIEMAEAAGLALVPSDRRDPKVTTTFGVGELIYRAARQTGVGRIIVTLGGSATNDGGAGLLQALGVKLLDASGHTLPAGGAALAGLSRVSPLPLAPTLLPDWHDEIWIACDVDNPLTGPRGASAAFGPQKGATPEDVTLLDAALVHYAEILTVASGRDVTDIPGAGAAGGTAAGLLWLFPNAELRPGIDLVLDTLDFDRHLAGTDLVLTGEGRLDAQTLGGKAIAGVARRARAAGVPVGAFVGGLTGDLTGDALARNLGVDAVLPIPPRPCTLDEAIANAAPWLTDAAERAARWWRLGAQKSGI